MVQDERVLVFSYDYYPGINFDVVSQLETGTTVSILQTVDEETVPEISQPDEYTGHIIRYDIGGSVGITAFLFSRDVSLDAGDSGTLSDMGSMFSPTLNLMQTSVQ